MSVFRQTPKGITYRDSTVGIKHWDSNGVLDQFIPNVISLVTKSWMDTRTSTNLPDWKTRIKALENATTALSGQRIVVSVNEGSYIADYYSKATGLLYRSEDGAGTSLVPDLTPPTGGHSLQVADNLAKRSAFRKLKELRTSFSGLTFLGEAGEALHMLRNRGRQLFSGALGYLSAASKVPKRFPKQKRRHRNETLSNLWLEQSFGWRPLIMDIEGASNALLRLKNKRIVTRITAVGQDVYENDRIDEYQTVQNIPAFRVRFVTGSVKVRYIIGMCTENQTSRNLSSNQLTAERFGLTLSEFVPTVWELIPYSFLVDYFTNIGDIIDAGFTSTEGVKWVCKTSRWLVDRLTTLEADVVQLTLDNPSSDVSYHGSLGSMRTSSVYVEREPATLTLPSLEFSVPGFGTTGDKLKWINMAALAISHKKAINAFR